MIWAYHAVFKQTNAGGGNIRVEITFADFAQLFYGLIGADDYAAGRSVQVFLSDSTGKNIGYLSLPASIDNVTVPIIVGALTGTVTASRTLAPSESVCIAKSDSLVIIAAALALNEELTVSLRAKIKSALPTIATTGSTGTVTTTTTYSKVI